MRFAFETVIWGRRIENLELVLDTIAACGYEGIELAQAPDQVITTDGEGKSRTIEELGIGKLLELLKQRGLSLVGLAGGSLEQRIRFCGTYRDCFLYVEDVSVAEWCALTPSQDAGGPPPFKLALHPHWFMKVQRPEQASAILHEYRKRLPGRRDLLLLPDTAHLTLVDELPDQVVDKFYDDLAAVHLKDWDPAYGRYSHRYSQGFVTLGKGRVRLKETLEVLQRRGYGGWVVVEQDLADPSPARSASACSKWLHAEGYMRPLVDDEINLVFKRELEATSPRKATLSGERTREALVLERLIPATVRGPEVFYQSAVEAIKDLYGFAAVKIYSYYPMNEVLYLRSVAGVEGHQCRTVLELIGNPYQKCITSQSCEVFDLADPTIRGGFNDDSFFNALSASRVVTYPIFNPSSTHHLRCLLSLVSNQSREEKTLPSDEIERLGMLISRLADGVAAEICSAAATRATLACSGVKTRKEWLRNILDLVRKEFDCEAASIFLLDETGERLVCEPEGTTGIEWCGTRKGQKEYYRLGEGTIGIVWKNRELRLETNVSANKHGSGFSWEVGRSQGREELIFAPIVLPGSKVHGVIRAVNKQAREGFRAATMFTDEDAAKLDAIIQAAIPHLELLTLQERQASAILRMTHEFNVPLVAIRGAVDFARNDLNKKAAELNYKGVDAASLLGEDYFGDILNWTQLMGRLSTNARLFAAQPGEIRLQLKKTLLMGEIIAPAVNQVGLLLKEKSFKKVSIKCGAFSEVPPLWVDRHQFQQVFFNLLSNAIKYSHPDELNVSIDGGAQGSLFLVWFSDRGIGVPPGLEEDVFLPGFRSQAAREPGTVTFRVRV